MNDLRYTDIFRDWLDALDDPQAKARILARLDQAAKGNFGDCQPVGSGVSEMRIHVGRGYRVYYVKIGKVIYVILLAGHKGSQQKDIKVAIRLAKQVKEENHDGTGDAPPDPL